METKKFCKFCGEQINKESVVCPKCGRQIEKIMKLKEENKKTPETTNNDLKFYEQKWFMWIMLIFFAPVGIFFMWKFHPEIKNKVKIILSIVFAVLFIIFMSSTSDDDNENNLSNNKYEQNKKIEVTVVDFQFMEKNNIENWCNDNKINCKIIDEYSDSLEKGAFISQSINANTKIYQGDEITIIYSLGKEPSTEYKNALKKAESYSKIMHMSKQGIYDQLTSEYGEQFSSDAAQYAIDNIEADWNANALEKAKTYQNTMNMSKNAIYDQLISEYGEKFTKEEAQYAIDHLND